MSDQLLPADQLATAEQPEPAEQPAAPVVDPAILQSTQLAIKALTEITELETIGAPRGHIAHEDTLATLLFESLLPGYPGWRWAATLAKLSETDPVTVLEVEMIPGDDALLAPEWVPWAERLAAYRKTQREQAEEEAALAAQQDLDDPDDNDLDDDDFDDLDDDDDLDGDDLLDNDHTDFDSDIDGVDIDSLADFDGDSDDDDSDDENQDEETETGDDDDAFIADTTGEEE